MAHDVFISYSTHDKLTADAMCSIFEQNSIRCWIAPRNILPGMDWAGSIVEAIANSSVMVLILSSTSNISRQVKREVELAVSKDVIIVPFRIEDVQLSKPLEYFLSTTHWMDALTTPVESHIQNLAKQVQVVLSSRVVNPAPQDETPAPESQQLTPPATAEVENSATEPSLAEKDQTPPTIEDCFYDLAKQKRISRDILLAVLDLLDKNQAELSTLEQQQQALAQQVFEHKLDALEFVRKWDRLSYEIENAAKAVREQQERERLEQEKLAQQKKAEEEKAAQAKLEQEKLAQQKQAAQGKPQASPASVIIKTPKPDNPVPASQILQLPNNV